MSIRLKDTANITAKSAKSATKATKATQDSAGQQINTTYIKDLSVNGRTITYTKGDGSTGTITTQDTNTDTNTTYTLSKNGSTITLTGSDGKTTSVTDSNTTYSTGTSSTAGLTKLYTDIGTATDGTMTQAAIKTALDGKAASSHTHGLLHDNFTAELANTTTDNGWSMINSNYNGHLLKSLRTNASAPAWILNDFSAGIAFGGADTKGVMSIAYKSPSVRFAGGNGTKPVWYFTLSGTSAKVYNMDSLAANTANTLATARTINGTSFNGSANITTANWGTARNISIADNDGTNTGTAVSVNGSANATLKLPATIKAALAGNATTATTLQTARTINGTSFNGSANITTANWGTARNITIGNTAKSVNGSANVSWSLSEIGAAPASHTHSYLPLSGGTLTSSIKFSGGGYNSHAIRMEAGDANGAFIGIGAGGLTVIGSGESTDAVRTALTNGADETMIVASDQTIRFLTGVQNGYSSAKEVSINTSGVINAPQGMTGNASTATKLQTVRTINGTNFDGSANITTANWGTARTITVGKTGKSVNGSGNVSWSLSEIGALPLAGGTLSGRLTADGRISAPTAGSSWTSGMTVTNATIGISTQQSTNTYHPVLAVKTSGNHVVNIGGNGDNFGFYGFKSGRTENGTDWSFKINVGTGEVSSTGNIKAPTFVGALSGNASTATTLQTARTINGTNFNGSANITTANWGTARNIYIADSDGTNTGSAVSVNGSGNATLKLPSTIKAALSGNASTATKLATGRTIKVGNTGKTFDGSGGITFTLADIGIVSGTSAPNNDDGRPNGTVYFKYA